jgi:hypothetical protein
VSEIPQEWVESGAEAIEYETGFAGDDFDQVARAVIEDVLPAIRLAIAEDLRAEARRMRETYRERADRRAPDGPGEPPNLDSWAKAYEAAAHRIEAATYPWRRKPY